MLKSKNNKNELLFTPYLDNTEDIVWTGQPNPYRLLSGRDLYLIPFSFMWSGFAIFWGATVLREAPFLLILLWGIPFVVMGQYFIWGRFVHKYFRRRHVYYAITKSRVIVLQKGWQGKFDSYYLKDLLGISIKGHDIGFGWYYSKKHQGLHYWHGEAGPGFYGLTEPEKVYKILQQEVHHLKGDDEVERIR